MDGAPAVVGKLPGPAPGRVPRRPAGSPLRLRLRVAPHARGEPPHARGIHSGRPPGGHGPARGRAPPGHDRDPGARVDDPSVQPERDRHPDQLPPELPTLVRHRRARAGRPVPGGGGTAARPRHGGRDHGPLDLHRRRTRPRRGFWDESRFGRGLSAVILRVTDVFLAFPTLVLAIALTAILGKSINSLTAVIIALTVTWWPYYVRIVRGEVLVIKHMGYIHAARIRRGSPNAGSWYGTCCGTCSSP